MSLVIHDYLCPDHGTFESIEERPAPEELPCPECQAPSPICMSAVFGSVRVSSISQGKIDKPELATFTSTETIGEGESVREWKKRRVKMWRDHDYTKRKDMLR